MRRRDLRQANDDDLLNIAEAAAFLGDVSIQAIRLWDRQGRLASHRIGKRVFFKVRDLKAFIEAGRRPARSEAVAAR